MANDLTKNPWVIDTAGATSTWTGPVYIQKIRWVPAAAGDDLVINDKNGEEIFSVTNALTGGVAGTIKEDFIGMPPYHGFNVATIGGGTLYVYVA
jgi:hypothetical protein